MISWFSQRHAPREGREILRGRAKYKEKRKMMKKIKRKEKRQKKDTKKERKKSVAFISARAKVG